MTGIESQEDDTGMPIRFFLKGKQLYHRSSNTAILNGDVAMLEWSNMTSVLPKYVPFCPYANLRPKITAMLVHSTVADSNCK